MGFCKLTYQVKIFPFLKERAQIQGGDATELSVVEAKLAWIVHIIAAILKLKQSVGCR